MRDLFKDKYRIPSTRLKNWDYSSTGWYFVTICVKDMECFLGEVVNGKMILSKIGVIVNKEWLKTEKIRFNVKLDTFQIMPNHLHGIIIINNVETTRRVVSTNKTTLQQNSLGSIIGQFKSVSTKRIYADGFYYFHWQSRFYDHIIRSKKSLNEIREYIRLNPLKWDIDENNPKNFKIC